MKALLVGEYREGKLLASTYETLAFAQKIGAEAVMFAVGSEADLPRFDGRLYLAGATACGEYNPQAHKALLLEVIAKESPDLVVLCHSSYGWDLAPRLAVALKAAQVSEVVGYQDGAFVVPACNAKLRRQVRQDIRDLQQGLGLTSVYVTHDQEEALTLSDRIAVFNQGRVLQIGPPKALYERPANRFVADFIGINNLVDGTVRAIEGARRYLRVDTVVGELAAINDERLNVGDRCVICIRPENATVDGEAASDRNRLKGTITFAAYLGNTLRYDVDLGHGVTFKADIGDPWHHEQLEMGRPVTLSCPIASTLAIPAE